MSVFQPVDVRAPDQRRKQLVQKLMQQQAMQSVRPGLTAPARPLAASARMVGGRATGVQHNNIVASILSRLGAANAHMRDDAESGFGPTITAHGSNPYASGHYVSPREAQAGGTPIAAPGGSGMTGSVGPGDPGWTGGYVWTTPDGIQHSDNLTYIDTSSGNKVIPLGNGTYYDPILDSVGIHGPGQTGAGLVARGM